MNDSVKDSFLASFALGLVITNGAGLGSYPVGTDSETELELNKLKDLAKADLIAIIASEKAPQIEKMQEANLNKSLNRDWDDDSDNRGFKTSLSSTEKRAGRKAGKQNK
ncbi:hypothetical protein Tco_0355502 [Tanacetum coccineum]